MLSALRGPSESFSYFVRGLGEFPCCCEIPRLGWIQAAGVPARRDSHAERGNEEVRSGHRQARRLSVPPTLNSTVAEDFGGGVFSADAHHAAARMARGAAQV